MNKSLPATFEVFWAFLILGLTSFGGPVAHLGYFRREFVVRRRWLDETQYASVLGLCQVLPGPASSQVGFAIGLWRAGWAGGLAAWAGFTLPSAVLMLAFGLNAARLGQFPAGGRVLHGLQLAALVVVAQAVWQMAQSLCRDFSQRLLGLIAVMVVVLFPGMQGQMAMLVIAGLVGWYFLDAPASLLLPADGFYVSRRGALICLGLFFILLGLAFSVPATGMLALASSFYRTGALVFGGGHVVVPLLNDALVQTGQVPVKVFLAGYGLAQIMPGPLFTLAAYVGAVADNGAAGLAGSLAGGLLGGVIALVALFLPGLLLVAGVLPFWQGLRQNVRLAAAVSGLNAAVVGLLGASLINLTMAGTIHGPWDGVILLAAGLGLIWRQLPPFIIVTAVTLTAMVV